jgi:tetratricopeptide (TPR) repeat protein
LRYAQIAMAYKPRAQYVLQYQCEAYQQQKREDAYLETLREGLRSYPEYQYFFPRLADYYKAQNENDSLLMIADYGLQVNSKEPLFLLAKSIALLNLERYDECVSISKEMIALNDSLSEAHFNIATCYLNQALELEQKGEPRKHREELRKLYAAARPYMEKYRTLLPDDKKRWAPALYRIYLNLNMGKQFEEIDRLMR